jgi:HK97 family phage portal protein
MGLLDKLFKRDASVKHASNNDYTGQPNGIAGPWDTMEGWFPAHFNVDWYQKGYTPGGRHSHNPDVAAAISLYKRALMAVPARHIKRNQDGAGIEVDAGSALSDVLFRPNNYMSWAEMIGVIVDQLLTKGEFACYVEEDGRGRKTTIHPLSSAQMTVAPDGEVFYGVTFPATHTYLSEFWREYAVDNTLFIPQRHVVHGRFEVDPYNPTRALAPLHAYANSIGLGTILRQGQEAFHNNKGQPSGVLTTDASLTPEQASRLRERWNEMSQKMRQGETPILSNGLRWQSTSVSANESQVIQLLGFTTKDVAKAFGIPPVMLGENSGVTYSNLEQLLYGWRTTGLLSLCMVIEQAFEHTFGLPKHEEMILDISDLARAEIMHQAETLKGLVLNGIMKPNEARARLDLAPIAGVADQLVSQQQVQPMQQNAELAARNADREDKKVTALDKKNEAEAAAKLEAAKNPPPVQDDTAPKEPTVDTAKEIDIESLDLMLKGVFR